MKVPLSKKTLLLEIILHTITQICTFKKAFYDMKILA